MTKRVPAMLLAFLIFITSFPVTARASGGDYIVSLHSDAQNKTLSVGDTVTITVTVAGKKDSVSTYHAYDLKFSYNNLDFVSAAAPDDHADVKEAGGHIRVKGYGKEKDFSTAPVVLTFKIRALGTASVSLTNAKIDNSDNAGLNNAPQAILAEQEVRFTVDGFEVEAIGDGIELGSSVATSAEDFTFSLVDFKNFDYTIKVTVNDVNLTSKVISDKETGKYTIPKEWIDGKIVITVEECTPKTYTVSFPSKEITGEKTAEYGTPYTFTLLRDNDYVYTVTVTISGEEYTGYDMDENTYTIPGADVTGNIKIKVKKELDYTKLVFITFAGSGGKDGSGEKKTDRLEEYDFKIKRKKGYTYSLTVYVDGRKTPYDYDYELDTYYILKEHVTGNITIVIRKIATVEVSEYITLEKQSVFLLVYNGIVGEGQVPKYDGRSMYWSDRYNAYVWLVVSGDSDKKVKKAAEGKITLNEGMAAGSIDYSGDVNKTNDIDQTDAGLIWEMYEGRHSLDFMEMRKLLNADVHSDRKLNVQDVAVVVEAIS